jgi:hypothetical protein
MKLKITVSILGLLLSWATLSAQSISMYSAEMETAVKRQIGLAESLPLTREITGAIFTLNLSASEITDIRDIIYFPNLQSLDLSYNEIRDLTPLNTLRYLTLLNVSNNLLTNANVLIFTESTEMMVDLQGNYISSFELLQNSMQCKFVINGIWYQRLPYRVNDFYTDYNLQTMEGFVNSYFWCLHKKATGAIRNGNRNFAVKSDSVQQTSMSVNDNSVYLMLRNEVIDSSHFVMPQTIELDEDPILITPSFPMNDYTVLSVETLCPDAKIAGDSITLTRPDSITNDTVKIAFGYLYENGISRLKGYTYVIIKEREETGIKAVQAHSAVHVFPNPASNFVNITGMDSEIRLIEIYSPAGQRLHAEKPHTGNVNISSLPAGVYIVRIHTDKDVTDKKLVKK